MNQTAKRAASLMGGPAPAMFGVLSVIALVPALLEHGGFSFVGTGLLAVRIASLLFAAIFAMEFFLGLLSASDRRRYMRDQTIEFLLLLGLLVCFLLETFHPFGFFRVEGMQAWVVPAQFYLLVNLLLKLLRLFKAAARTRFNYARAFGISFVVIILIGALLLYLVPGAMAPGQELGFVDAVFTATSATCVTGLVTVDTGTQFSRFGQTVILCLFQVGGLGLMTFAAFFAIALGKGMGIKDREVMKGVLNLETVGKIGRVIVGILVLTVIFEAVGAVVLYSQWQGIGEPHDRLFHSVFHSVSAFCNAGFSLNSTSLTAYQSNSVVNLVVMFQIVIGGLGFGVLLELLGLPVLGWRRFRRKDRRLAEGTRRARLSVQTRIVLVSSLVLILLGSGLIYLFESDNPATLGGMDSGSKVQAAVFQSVTTRTAGFNTISIGEMTDPSKFLMLSLMLVGASPGSTGGGIKTVTAVIMLLTVIAMFRGRRRVEVSRRVLPADTVNKVVVIVFSAIAVVMVATLVVVAAESGRGMRFLDLIFETGSAFGTVGLSTGVTPDLSVVSKLTLCLVMLIGRIGPLSLVIALSQSRAARRYRYPEESVMIG